MAEVVLDDVRKRFASIEVLKGISGTIKHGELRVVLGPSGCGKSTLLRVIAGLEEITSGAVRIGDRIVNRLEPKDRDIAMVFQNYALYPHMSVYDNMAYGLRNRRTPRDEIERRVQEAARILGLGDLLQRKPRQLSGGQRQRVAMGRAIVREPAVFLFDEPLSNLDAKLRAQMRIEIKQLQQRLGTTGIFVTHDQVEAMTLGDRLMVMNAGVVEQVGTPLEVYERPATLFVAGFIGSPTMNLLEVRLRREGDALFAERPGMRIELPAALAETLARHRDREVVLGVRPEHVHLVAPTGAPDLEATVEFTEQLGSEMLVSVTVAATRLTVARAAPDLDLVAGAPVSLRFDRDHLHLFDRATETALAHGRGARQGGPRSERPIATAQA